MIRYLLPFTAESLLDANDRALLDRHRLRHDWPLEYVLARYQMLNTPQHLYEAVHNHVFDTFCGDLGDFLEPPGWGEELSEREQHLAEIANAHQFEAVSHQLFALVTKVLHQVAPLLGDPNAAPGKEVYSHFVYQPFLADSCLLSLVPMEETALPIHRV